MNHSRLPLVVLVFLFAFQFVLTSPIYSNQYAISILSNRDGIFVDFRKKIAINMVYARALKRYATANIGDRLTIPTLEFAYYTLKDSDSILSVSSSFGLDADTIVSVNNIPSTESFNSGMSIIIPSMRGIVYKAEERISLKTLEKEFSISATILQKINRLDRSYLYLGEEIFIPNGKLSKDEWSYFNHRVFIQPLTGQLKITSKVGWRVDPFTHKRTYHGGIDMAAKEGTAIYASQSGEVIHSGWAGGYGKLVVIAHNYGFKTYYGHCSSLLVKQGQKVQRGQIIARVGSTGRSTGPHLHFEMRKFNHIKNPLSVESFVHQ